MSTVRLAEIDDVAEAIAVAFQRAAAVAILPHLRADHAGNLEREVVRPLHDAIGIAIAGIAELELELEGQDVEGLEWDDALEPTRDGPARWLGRMLSDELWQQVADVCFVARGELRRAERTIRRTGASHEDRLAACEGAHRKLQRVLGGVLATLGRARGGAVPVIAELAADIESAVAVRRMYARFRRSLPACDPADPASVRGALRCSAVSLAAMVGGNEFGDVRTSDRALLLELQGRILGWARDGASERDGAQLYRDIVTAAELLRSINLRQELAAHDRRMLREAAAALAAADPAAAIATAAPALHALDGRDDALDAAVERALREPPSQDRLAALRAAVAALPTPEAVG